MSALTRFSPFRKRFALAGLCWALSWQGPVWAEQAAPALPATAAAALPAQPPTRAIAVQFGQMPEPAQVRRIVSAGPPADVFLLSLVPELLLGLSSLNIRPEAKQFFAPTARNLPSLGRLAGRGSTFPMEKLLALQPDLIIDIGNASLNRDDTYTSTAARTTEQTQIPYVLVNGSLATSGQQLRELGALIHQEDRAEALATFADSVVAQAASVRAAHSEKPVRFYYARGADGLETGLAGSIHTEALEMLGAVNVAQEAGKASLARVSMEQLLAWQPEAIFTQDRNVYQALRQKTGLWGTLAAVQAGRVYLLPNLPFGWMDSPPSLNRLLGLIALPALLYPDAPHGDWKKQIQDYFALFYGYDLSREALNAMLEGQ